MKRVYDYGFNNSVAVVHEDANKAKLQHQTLLKEFLVLQKEFVTKKKKLQSAKEKRDNLLAEVLFLRRRHKHLLKNRSSEMEREKDVIHRQNLEAERINVVLGERSNGASEAAFVDSCCASLSNSHMLQRVDEGLRGGGGVGEPRIAKMPKNYLIDDERLGKKKKTAPCRNQATLKV